MPRRVEKECLQSIAGAQWLSPRQFDKYFLYICTRKKSSPKCITYFNRINGTMAEGYEQLAFNNPVIISHILDFLVFSSTSTVRRLSSLNRIWNDACSAVLPRINLSLSIPVAQEMLSEDLEVYDYRLLCIDSAENMDGVRIWRFAPCLPTRDMLLKGTDVFSHSSFCLCSRTAKSVVECKTREFDPEKPFCTGGRIVAGQMTAVDELIIYFRSVDAAKEHHGWSNDYRLCSVWMTDALVQRVLRSKSFNEKIDSIWPSRIDRWFRSFNGMHGPPSQIDLPPAAIDAIIDNTCIEFRERICRTWPGVRFALFDQARRCELFLLSVIGNLTDHGSLAIDRKILATCMFIKSSVGDALDAIRNWRILDAASVDGYMDSSGTEGAASAKHALVEAFWNHEISLTLMETVPGGPYTYTSSEEDVFDALVFLHKTMLHGMFFRPYEVAPDGDIFEMKGCGGGGGNKDCKFCSWNRDTLFPVQIKYFTSEDFVDIPVMAKQKPGSCLIL
ncbi:hypothetical protein BC829DRAFT_31170 [Chytridium lagenaria]|nr:hypothetical protein BC829DRAFT_31170 [Chytridium lagenaria]